METKEDRGHNVKAKTDQDEPSVATKGETNSKVNTQGGGFANTLNMTTNVDKDNSSVETQDETNSERAT